MEIDYPSQADIPALKALWREAFDDTDELIDDFFRTGFSPLRCRKIGSDGRVDVALYWFDAVCGGEKWAYLYAVATREACRGRGLCRSLIADTHALLQRSGYFGCLLVPGDETLGEMYEKMGYRPCTTVKELSAAAGEPIPLRQLTTAEFAALRRRLLPYGGAVQEGNQLAYLGCFSQFYAGEDFVVAAMKDGKTLRGELLGSAAAAPGIIAALGCTDGCFHSPGPGRDYAMCCSLRPDALPPDYFGLALD